MSWLDAFNATVFSYEWMRDIVSVTAFQALRIPAAHVEPKPLGATSQEPNASAVADADKEVEVQREGFGARNDAVAPSMFVAELDRVLRATENAT